MFEILLAAAVCGLGLRAIHGSFVTEGGRLSPPRLDISSVRLWILMCLAAILIFKLKYGSALVLALMLHELGHVAAHRLIGHSETRFRLAPLITGTAISARPTRNQTEQFFVTIMGAGFSLVPMVAALVLAQLLEGSLPDISSILYAAGSTIAVPNFINLLPLPPLDGGKCLRQIFITLCPVTGSHLLLTFSAGAAALSFVYESMSLITIVCLGALVFFRPEDDQSDKAPMPHATALLALAIYGFTFASHAVAGWWLIRWYFW